MTRTLCRPQNQHGREESLIATIYIVLLLFSTDPTVKSSRAAGAISSKIHDKLFLSPDDPRSSRSLIGFRSSVTSPIAASLSLIDMVDFPSCNEFRSGDSYAMPLSSAKVPAEPSGDSARPTNNPSTASGGTSPDWTLPREHNATCVFVRPVWKKTSSEKKILTCVERGRGGNRTKTTGVALLHGEQYSCVIAFALAFSKHA